MNVKRLLAMMLCSSMVLSNIFSSGVTAFAKEADVEIESQSLDEEISTESETETDTETVYADKQGIQEAETSTDDEIVYKESTIANGVDVSVYSEEEIEELLCTAWGFGLSEEEIRNVFDMSEDEFVEYRKSIKISRWEVDGYFDDIVLSEMMDLAGDEDFLEWVSDEQIEEWFGMDRESFEMLGKVDGIFGNEYLQQTMNIDNGSTLSSALFKASVWSSWRHNWYTSSKVNPNRSTGLSTSETFKQMCVDNFSSTYDCSAYVSAVLRANGEFSDGESYTSADFATALENKGYKDVSGKVQLVENGAYTDDAKATIQSICSGDILVWYYQEADGSFSPKHVSIGYIYDGEPLTTSIPALETLEEGEVCVYQSNGASPATCGVESVAYYLSGANSSASYGTVVQIFRKTPIRGSVSVEKTTTTGNDLSGNVFSLYKVSTGRSSYLNAAGNALISTPDLSGVTDTTSAEDGVLTKIATFTTDENGVGVPTLTTIISNAHNNAVSISSDWYSIGISGNTITGLPLGDYIIIEDKSTTDKSCWDKGGTYGGKTLSDTTVRCSITTKNGSYTTSYNGIIDGSVNSLCDFGLGQGLQYYSAFTVDNIFNNGVFYKEANNKSVKFNNENNNSLKLKKTSSNTSVSSGNSCYSLKNAVYAVYEDVNNNGYNEAASANKSNYTSLSGYVGTLTTDENGTSNLLSGLSSKKYYVKEISAPKGYALDSSVHTVNLGDKTKMVDNVYTLELKDTPQMDPIDILVCKKDSEDSTVLAGAEFTVKFYAGEYADGVNPASLGKTATRSWVLKTDSQGYARTDDAHKVSGSAWYYNENNQIEFPLGTITIQETKAPDGYKADTTVYVRRITSSGTSETVTTYNAPTISDVMYRKLTLQKTSANTSISDDNNSYTLNGAVYAVYDNKNSASVCTSSDYKTLTGYIGALTTDSNGKSNTISSLLPGKYYVKEVVCPKGYAIDTTVYEADLTTKKYLTIETYTASSAEQPKSNPVDIVLKKTDEYTDNAVSGAEFTVMFYAGEYADGVNPATSGATASRSWVIKTDSNGYAKLDEAHKVSGGDFYYNSAGKIVLPLGTVTIQETKAPDDYIIDKTIYVRRITDDSAANVSTVNSFKYVEEQETPKRKSVEFYKLAETSSEGVYNPLANAGFMAANVDDLKQDANGNYIWDESKAVAFNANGTADDYSDDTRELFTDENGYAKSAKLLNGTYLLHESTVPDNYTAIEDQVFTIYTEEYSDEPLYLGYYSDNLFKGYLKIVKKDSVTGKNLLNTDGNIKFKIWSYDEDKYVSFSVYDAAKGNNVTIDEFTINNDGLVVTPGKITSGKYRLEEINTTKNYYSEQVDNSYDFTINNKTIYEQYVDGDGVVSDIPVFTIERDNTPVYGTISVHKAGEYYEEENGKITKKDVNLNGVTFDIVADEDIISGDGQTLLIAKGSVADTLVTDKDGNATSKDLPLGKYHISERDTVDGYYAMEDVSFELSTSKGITTSDLGNGKQKKSVDVKKELVNYKEIELKTTATDANTGIKNTNAAKNAKIYDDVYCKNLVVGKTYTIKGKLYDKETGNALLIEGKEVTATKTFKADNGIMTVRMEYSFDASSLAGKQTVVFEDLYESGKIVATHSSLSDANQTIRFPEVHTTAYGKDTDDHLAYVDEQTTIVDKVEYSNLIVGKEYTVDGVLMNQKTGKALTVNGKTITASKTFNASKSDGYVELEFTFDASALNGETVVVFEDLKYEKITVATHSDINDEEQTVHFPKISTTATGKKTADHIAYAEKETTIVDKVSYTNLIKGKIYTVSGTLMDVDTGKAVTVNGKAVTAEKTFTAEAANGSVDVEFTFDASALSGITTVVYETLSYNGKKVAVHNELSDKDQTVYIPKISTTATDKKTDEHITYAEKEATITDKVSYTNLYPGKEYRVSGVIMDVDTGKELLSDGKTVTAEITFTPDSPDGEVELEFTFDASELCNHTLVVFEELYRDDIIVAAHRELTDKDQTVQIPDVHTTALGNDSKDHLELPGESVTIVDKVNYSNLLVGKTYTVSGTLMNKSTGEELNVNGNPVTAEKTFTADEKDGYVELEFTFDASALIGESVVAFETVTYEEIPVATHTDIDDEEQTVHFPKIATEAKEKTKGTHETMAADKYEIVDTVSYENLIAGRYYIVKGTLMDKSTELPVVCDDADVTSEFEFVPETESGSVDVDFVFYGRNFAGLDTVVYEELYVVSECEEPDDEISDGENENTDEVNISDVVDTIVGTDSDDTKMSLIAFHKDIDDEGQSVYIDYTRINITKVDSETGEVVCGAEISLCDEAGNVVDTWITEEEPHYLENVPAGKYTLVENAAPNGYEVAETLSIVIEDVPELQSFTMEDDVIKGNIHITKIDSDNQDKKLSGVKFVLFKTCETVINTSVDRDIVSAWENIADSERENINGYKVLAEDLYIGSYVTDDNGEFSVEGLTYGTYYLVETETQKGYTMLSDITGFVIDEENLDNDITISNEGRIGWITYQITTRTVPGADNIVKTGDDSPILLIIAIILLILGIPVYRYGSKKIKKWHMIIPLAFMLVPVTHMSASAKENTDTTEYVTVDIESYVDSEYAASEPEHDSSIDYTYTYSETGETYKVQLPYTGKKLLESGYVVPVTLTGTIYDYNAEYFMCNGIKYNNPGDDLSRIEDILVSFVESEGYSADSYRNLSYDFSGEAYEDSDGLLCRDFKLTFDTYGVKFRFYYGKTFDDLVSVAKTESTLNSSDKQFDNTTQTNAVLEKEDDTVAASTQETTSTQESVSNQTVADDSAASQDMCSNAENESILENNQEEKQETSQETTETSSHTRLSATRLVSAVILMVIICGLCVMLVLVIRKTGKK